MKYWQSIKVPPKMEHLQKDKRGYPIPFSIFKDKKGEPQFTRHDFDRLRKCMEEKLCSICGIALNDDIWLVAGARTALEPRGAYIDPPMHKECSEYSLQTCPYLAMPSFRKRSPNDIEGSYIHVLDGKPSVFALVRTSGYLLIPYDNAAKALVPKRPFLQIEYWREGIQISGDEAKKLI